MPKRLYTIGVGPGSIKYITDIAREAIYKSRYIIGYKYTISAVESLIDKNKQEIYVISLKNQEELYQYIYDRMKDEEYCAVCIYR